MQSSLPFTLLLLSICLMLIAMPGLVLGYLQLRRKETTLSWKLADYSFEAVGLSAAWIDPNARIIRVNEAACRSLGYTREELEGSYIYKIDPDFPRDYWPTHWEHLKHQKTLQIQSRHQRKDGSLFPVEITINYVEFNGQAYNFAFAQNVSDRLEAEAALKHLNNTLEEQVNQRTEELQQALEFEALLKRVTDKVRDSLDENQILQTVVHELGTGLNVIGCATADYTDDRTAFTITHEYIVGFPSVQNQQFDIAMHPQSAVFEQLFQGHYIHCCTLDPTQFSESYFAIMACPIFDDRNFLADLWLLKPKEDYFHDLEIRLVQQVANQCAIAIRQARLYQAAKSQVQQLEFVNTLKDDFLSTVSHEMRTPVANIKMAIQMLEIFLSQQQGYEQRQQDRSILGRHSFPENPIVRYLKILKDESDREMNLINDILALSQLEANTDPWQLSELRIQPWLLQIIEPFQERIHHQNQVLTLNLPDNLPALTTDFDCLKRILTELINNACKYTPPGDRITISAKAHPYSSFEADEPSTHIELKITNSGVEIPDSELGRIFDKFYRIPSHDRWKHGGTGLGLALVKKLVGHLGGQISVKSTHAQTSFTVKLPLHPNQAEGGHTITPQHH